MDERPRDTHSDTHADTHVPPSAVDPDADTLDRSETPSSVGQSLPAARLTQPIGLKTGALPSTIGRFRVRRIIGSGGMGIVFEAQDPEFDRSVAIKVIRQRVASPATLARFEEEARLLARLQHPSIAAIYDAGRHEDEGLVLPYLALEYVPAARILTKYANEEQLDTVSRLKLVVMIARAVQYGHEQGVIHRDLKPGNVLVGRDGTLKIIDFGVAHATGPAEMESEQARRGLVGTLAYMSPEQCEGDPARIDARTDVYSVGALLYELLVGQVPIEVKGLGVGPAVKKIRTAVPKAPSSLKPDVPASLDGVVLRALAKPRRERYPSAAELADELTNWLSA
jgi:serine/threonine protein kinase